MHILWCLIVVGGLIILAMLNAPPDRAKQAKSRKIALQLRLRAFEREQRIRQNAAAKRCAHELNMLAYDTYRMMLLTALDLDRSASQTPGKQRRCR